MADDADIKKLYCAARKIDVPDERSAFLDASCEGDATLRRNVAELLDARRHATGSFLEKPFVIEDFGPALVTGISQALGEHIGPYELISVLGEGGMGTVYRARQSTPVKRDVALKVVKHGMASATVVARFEAERQALALMDHANIAKVFDAGTTEHGQPYFVMELVNGLPLTKYCTAQNLPARERLRLFVDVCRAIQHAHQKGIIHRDIKPSNILVAFADGKAVPKVIDFGVAKAIGQKLTEETMNTQTGLIMGTLDYMSPEQAGTGETAVDARTDVYALGAVLYEMLTGVTPLGSRDKRPAVLYEALRIIREVEPERPSMRMSFSGAETTVVSERDVRGELDWIALKALDKSPARRYQSADGFADDIERHLNGEAVSASPDSGMYRLKKFIGRNRAMSVAAGAVAMALVLGLCAALWQADRAMTAEKLYKEQRDAALILQKQADDARAISERTLADLKRTAPVFFTQAKIDFQDGKLNQALEKLGYAIQLDDANADYHLYRAHLLQSSEHLVEAAKGYRRVLELRPSDKSAEVNLALCEKWLGENNAMPLGRAAKLELLGALRQQQRPIEAAPLAAIFDPDIAAIRATISMRLRSFQKETGWSDINNLSANPDGTFTLKFDRKIIPDFSVLAGLPISGLIADNIPPPDLRQFALLPLTELQLTYTHVAENSLSALRGLRLEKLVLDSKGVEVPLTDISALQGMPLKILKLTNCRVNDISALAGAPLEELSLIGTRVTDLAPLAQCRKLTKLQIDRSPVSDLSPLSGLPLIHFSCSGRTITSISALADAPLKVLNIQEVGVTDLTPLTTCTQLEHLEMFGASVSDLRPLTKLKLKNLNIHGTRVSNLEPLRGMSLRWISTGMITGLTDLSPLLNCPDLESFLASSSSALIEPLRVHPRIKTILYTRADENAVNIELPAATFWKGYDAKQKKN